MVERPRHHPLLIVLAVVFAVLVVCGAAIEVLRTDGGDGHRSITEHVGNLKWVPRGEDPDPAMGSRYWTFAYPAAYASRVGLGVGLYLEEKRIGYVQYSEVDEGSVWVYFWVAPEYADVAAGITESEPIETAEGPRVQIYDYHAVPPSEVTAA